MRQQRFYPAKGAVRLRLLRSFAILLFVLSVPIALILTNIRITASQPAVYDYSVETYDAAGATGIPQKELKRANRELSGYLNSDDQRFLRIIVQDNAGQEQPLFSAKETAHLADVKTLFRRVFFVQEAAIAYALAFVAAAVLWAREMSLRRLASLLMQGGMVTIGVLISAGIGALVGFEALWEQFHFLAFANDFWALNPNRDHLIQMFPEEFWFDITLAIGAITILEALLLMSVAGAYLYVTREETAATASGASAAGPDRAALPDIGGALRARRLRRAGARGQ